MKENKEEKKKITIATHSSQFHSDDIFAVATLTMLLEKDHDIAVVRSRDKAVIDAADYVVDVGEEYDPARKRFDHHQEGRAGRRDNGIYYASFGLVWKEYGEEVCGDVEIARKIDQLLVSPIDANDNGMQIIEGKIENVFPYDLRSILYAFRPTWKEEENLDDIFMKLVGYARVLLLRQITCIRDQKEAVQKVEEAYHSAEDKRLIFLNGRYPWKDVLSQYPEPLFVVSVKDDDNTWGLQTVADDWRLYISRKDLPEEWAGKSGVELENITGVPGSIFCHVNRFLIVATTKEAILKLAEIALNS